MADGAVASDRALQRSIDVELRVLDEAERTIEVIASSEALDSHGDVIKQHWDFSRYEKNPVVLWNHNKFGVSQYAYEGSVRPEDLMPIGQALEWKVTGKKLVMKVKLASAAVNPVAERVWNGCRERVVRAVSVGFRPGNINAIKDKAGHTVRYELGSPEFPNALHELSFVPMGSNPEAVAKSIESDRQLLSELHAKQLSTEAPCAQESQEMTEQEKAAHAAEIKTAMDLATGAEKRAGDAEKALKAAQDLASTEKARADKTEADLKAEKAAAAVLEKDLADAKVKLDVQKDASALAMVKGYVGVKLTPAEQDEYVELAQKTLGIERTERLIKGRPDLAVTQPATAGGAPIVSSTPVPIAPVEDVEEKANDIANSLMRSARTA